MGRRERERKGGRGKGREREADLPLGGSLFLTQDSPDRSLEGIPRGKQALKHSCYHLLPTRLQEELKSGRNFETGTQPGTLYGTRMS